MTKLDILECTLRDAGRPTGCQFTAEDTGAIAAGLEGAGFRLIEIGHWPGPSRGVKALSFVSTTAVLP